MCSRCLTQYGWNLEEKTSSNRQRQYQCKLLSFMDSSATENTMSDDFLTKICNPNIMRHNALDKTPVFVPVRIDCHFSEILLDQTN